MNYWLLILNVLFTATSFAVEFKELVRNPRAYHRQKVTITGVARIQGLTFELYGSPADAKQLTDAKQALLISIATDGPRYDQLDNRWVVIKGVVNAEKHGNWGYPCVIFLDSVEPLPVRPAGKPFKNITGVFRNEDPTEIKVLLFDQAGKTYAEFSISPQGINGTGIRKGTAEVRGPNGRIVARHRVLTSQHHLPYRNGDDETYYFRIRDGRIADATAFEGTQWETHK